jgi:large subunit ribosomal protein L32
MAVPKKRTSSSKTKSRHATWVNKAIIQRERAISLAKSVLNDNSGSFVYSNNKSALSEEE